MPVHREVHEAAARGEALALARVLISIPSVNPALEPGGTGEGEVAIRCARWLEAWGFRVALHEDAPGRPSLLAVLGEEGPGVLLNGHLDTVGVRGMTIHPFDPVVAEGRLLGRGSCDMKAGVGAILSAACAVARRGLPRGRLLVALTADEEHASIGAMGMVQRGLDAVAGVVCEPTGLAVMPAHKGFAWVEVEVEGRAAHGSRPDLGVDAIRHAGHILAALGGLEAELSAAPDHSLLGRGSIHAGTISGGTTPSVYPDRCTFVLERRLLPHEPPERAVAEVQALVDGVRRREVPGLRARVTGGLSRTGTEVPVDHPVVTGLRRAIRNRGIPDRVEPMTAWVDAAVFNRAGIPTVCFGPGSIDQAHTAAEWCPVDEIEEAARVLEDWIEAVLGESGSPGGEGMPREGGGG